MSIALPTSPAPTEPFAPSYIDYGGILRPVLGGADQKLNRLGNRFSAGFVLPLVGPTVAQLWISRLIQAQSLGAIMRWRQPGFDPGTPGAALIDGNGQAGTTLAIKGMTAGYVIAEGQFFSIVHGGRRYLHVAGAAATVSGAGQVSLPIAPMLRIVPSTNDVCEFAQPKIEGFLEGNSREWTPSLAQLTGFSFKIGEAEWPSSP